jgi:hypothetical protein
MLSARFGLLLCILLLNVPSWGKQAAQQTPVSQPASDPQAVVVVQAAITALGGATAIGQAQNWTFQATLQGPVSSDAWSEIVTRYNGKPAAAASGIAKAPRRRSAPSLLVPALVGTVLLKEFQDPYFVMNYGGPATLGSEAVTQILFSRAGTSLADAQTWYFDKATGLPAQVEFKLPAQIGQMRSPLGVVVLSDYRAVSGVLHPFHFVMSIQGTHQLKIITVQAVSPSATDIPSAATLTGGAQ